MSGAVAAAAQKQPAPPGADIIKSPQDQRHYRRIVLANGLTALLISDPEMADAVAAADDDDGDADGNAGDSEEDDDSGEDSGSDDGSDMDADGADAKADKPQRAAKKAAAAMAVGVGSFSDPADLQGLSHYLEHMLFMGSEKFPDENDYDAYLASSGGASNAYTELELTNYQFDCEPRALHGALDRFAQFFLAPLCKADALEREVSAVDNEFAGVLQSDSCRLAQLRCHTARDGHPFRLFSWGNRRSLWDQPTAAGIAIRDRIVQYYRQQYSAERMCLVLLGGHSLDTLQQWVAAAFAKVPAGRGPRPEFAHAGLPFQGGRVYALPAVKDTHSVTVTFQLPSLQAAYAAKADEYLAHLVGHEGSGSLLSALKARGWATGLSAGVAEGGHERSSAAWLFDVALTLTDAGLSAPPGAGLAPVGLLFQFLNLLRKEGPQEWAFKELRDIAEMKFRFAEEEDACEYVTRVVGEMHQYTPAHMLKGAWVFGEWDPQLAAALLQQMTPQNARVDVQSASWDGISAAISKMEGASTGTEPWFGFDYAEAPLPPDVLQGWSEAAPALELALPQPNAFIASDFGLVCDAAGAAAADATNGSRDGAEANGTAHLQTAPSAFPAPPALAAEAAGLRLWHKADAAFRVPRCAAAFMLASPAAYGSPRAAALTHLAAKLLEDALCETAYQAEVAALTCEVSPEGAAGLALRLDGFSHKLPALAEAVFTTLATMQVEASAFQRVREALARRYRNANMRPEQAANYARLYALRAAMWHVDAVLPHVEAATPEDVQAHLKELLASTHLEALLHGNISMAGARAVLDQARAALQGKPLPPGDRPRDQAVQLPLGSTLYRERAKNAEEGNSVTELYLQAGPDTAELRAKVDLLEQVAGEPAYDTLRTKQQLGYSVHVGTRLTHGALGFCVTVASGTHAPSELEARIEAFLSSFAPTLDAMPAPEFEKHRASLLAAKLQKDRSLAEEADRHWGAIFDRRYDFQARQREVAALEALKQADLAAWYAGTIAPGGVRRHKLCVHIAGRTHAGDLGKPPADSSSSVIEDLGAWKTGGLPLYPAAVGELPPGTKTAADQDDGQRIAMT